MMPRTYYTTLKVNYNWFNILKKKMLTQMYNQIIKPIHTLNIKVIYSLGTFFTEGASNKFLCLHIFKKKRFHVL